MHTPVYLKFKVYNQKAKFVPRENAIYHRITSYTRKNAQVVTNLQQTCSNAVPTTCQQDVFALVLLVPNVLTSCQRLVDNLLQSC
jgi:hypothetical protein